MADRLRRRTSALLGLTAVTLVAGLTGCALVGEGSDEDQPAAAESTPAQTLAPEPTQEQASAAEPTQEQSSDDEPSGKPAASGIPGRRPSSGNTVDASSLTAPPVATAVGQGEGDVTVPVHDEPLVVVFTNTSVDESSSLYGTTASGDSLPAIGHGQYQVLVIDSYGPSGGLSSNTAGWEMVDSGDGPTSFTISFYSLDAVPVAEEGDVVRGDRQGLFRIDSAADTHYRALQDGDGAFDITVENASPEGGPVPSFISDSGSVDAGVEFEDGDHLVIVDAQESWTLTPIAEEEYADMAHTLNL